MVRIRAVAGLLANLAFVLPAVAQEQDGRSLYETNCASCHGAQFEGQPDWMSRLPNGRLPAPPHDETGHTWHHSDGQLFRIVKEGLAAIAPGYETDMPAFADRMTDDEIRAVIDFIKSTWPDRERDYQRSRSEADGP
ncbi:MAG: cytochrome [Devosia sp.]|nr:cytochrome [Devosia sp.]